MNRRQSTWMLHFIVLIFGFTGILGKLISLDAERLVFWRVLLGGGLSAAFPFFAASLQQEVERRVLAPSRQDLVIAPASLGNGAGRLGAARLALQRLPGRQG